MNMTFNPITGKLDAVGASAEEIEKSQQNFYGATPISNGTYWARIAQFNIVAGLNVGHNLVAMFHLMRCNAMPYSNRSSLGVKEATIFVSLSSIHTDDNTQEILFESSYGILQEEVMLIKTEHTSSKLTYELYARVYMKDRFFFTCRWNQLDKENVSVILGKESDELIGGFNPELPVFFPVASSTREYTIVEQTTVQLAHQLNKYPSVTIVDTDGDQVLADVHYDSRSEITITFQESFSGTIILN